MQTQLPLPLLRTCVCPGHLGSSVARLEEAKQRDKLHQVTIPYDKDARGFPPPPSQALDQRGQEVSQIIRKIFSQYGDQVSYNVS